MTSNNQDWDKGWFYLRNDVGRIPAYTGKVFREKAITWLHGISPVDRQAKIVVFTDALRALARKGLTAAAVIANFHRERVVPQMERRLPIYELKPGVPFEGSRMSEELLPPGYASQRAKRGVECSKLDCSDATLLGHLDAPRGGPSSIRAVSQGIPVRSPLPEVREANRLHAERRKAQKDPEKKRRERKQQWKLTHDKENRKREREGHSPLTTPESTPEPDEDSSDDLMGPPPVAVVEVEDSVPVSTQARSVPTSGSRKGTLDTRALSRARTPVVPAPSAPSQPPPSSRGAQPSSGSGKSKLLVVIRRTTALSSPSLVPTKALKLGARATPHALVQPSAVIPPSAEAVVARYQAALVQGVARSRQERRKASAAGAGTAGRTEDMAPYVVVVEVPAPAGNVAEPASPSRTGGATQAADGWDAERESATGVPEVEAPALAAPGAVAEVAPTAEVVTPRLEAADSVPLERTAGTTPPLEVRGGGLPAPAATAAPEVNTETMAVADPTATEGNGGALVAMEDSAEALEPVDAWAELEPHLPGLPPTLLEATEVERVLWEEYRQEEEYHFSSGQEEDSSSRQEEGSIGYQEVRSRC